MNFQILNEIKTFTLTWAQDQTHDQIGIVRHLYYSYFFLLIKIMLILHEIITLTVHIVIQIIN